MLVTRNLRKGMEVFKPGKLIYRTGLMKMKLLLLIKIKTTKLKAINN